VLLDTTPNSMCLKTPQPPVATTVTAATIAIITNAIDICKICQEALYLSINFREDSPVHQATGLV
jgi:hypothetical protein